MRGRGLWLSVLENRHGPHAESQKLLVRYYNSTSYSTIESELFTLTLTLISVKTSIAPSLLIRRLLVNRQPDSSSPHCKHSFSFLICPNTSLSTHNNTFNLQPHHNSNFRKLQLFSSASETVTCLAHRSHRSSLLSLQLSPTIDCSGTFGQMCSSPHIHQYRTQLCMSRFSACVFCFICVL